MRNRKSTTIFAVIGLIIIGVWVLSACTGETNLMYFDTDTEAGTPVYRLYLDTNPTITPSVVTRPRGNEYSLTSSNQTILKISDDGKSITALREGVVTLTATSDSKSAKATVIIEAKKPVTAADAEKQGGFLVIFETEYGSVAGQVVEPGEKAEEPMEIVRPNGYKLFGWYTDEEFTQKYDFDTPVNAHITLYALWGYAEPEYIYESNGDGTSSLLGFKYVNVPYSEVVLPTSDEDGYPITAIANSAFVENKTLESVTIPEGYLTVGESAFEECEALKTVIVSSSVTVIEKDAFFACPNLQSVTLGNAVTTIGEYAFYGCSVLESITLPDTLTELGAYAFAECEGLTSVELSDSLTLIDTRTFAGTAITNINLKHVAEIYNEAFAGCTSLTTIEGYENLTYIGSYVFGSLTRNSDKATAWLKKTSNQIVTEHNGVTGGKAVYLGDILVYVVPVATKCPIIYVKSTCKSIAGQALTDAGRATLYFTGTVPPEYNPSSRPFGEQSETVNGNTLYRPTVDIIVPSGMTETYTRAFLHCSEDADGDKILPLDYSFELCKRIYESVPTAIAGLTAYVHRPFMEYESGVYYNLALAKSKGDPYCGITYLSERRYVIFDYQGTAQSIDIKSELEQDSKAYGTTMIIERIDSYAFSASSLVLKSIILPTEVLEIDAYAFSAPTLTSVTFTGNTSFDPSKTAIESYGFNLNACKDLKIFVHADMYEKYKKASSWSSYSSRLVSEK